MRALRPLLLSLLVASCAPAAPPAAPTTPDQPAAATPAASDAQPTTASAEPTKVDAAKAEPPKAPEEVQPTVRLIDAGAAPKQALRYRFTAGATEYLEMDMKMTLAVSMGGKPSPKTALPTIRITMKLEAKEVTPEGDLQSTFNTEKVDVLKDVQVDPNLRQSLETELGGVVGMRGKARISTRGVVRETDFELPPNASPKLRTSLDNMRDAIRQMYTPFPEEEVGKGASWEVTSRLPLSGAMMESHIVCVLKKVDKNGAQMDVQTTLTAPPNQPMKIDALPPGSIATLESLSGTGSGQVSPLFTHLVSAASNKLAMQSTLSVAVQGQKVQMKMESGMDVSSRPRKAPAGPAPSAKKPVSP